MDVIILGVFDSYGKDKLNHLVLASNHLEIAWDFEKYNLESSKGISILKEFYNLDSVGILVEQQRTESFSSYPLIYEVTETFMGSSETPKLFDFLNKLKSSNLEKMVIAFADEWDENSLVKAEKCNYKGLKCRLNSPYVWCDSYLNLVSNTEIRGDEHPLVLEVER